MTLDENRGGHRGGSPPPGAGRHFVEPLLEGELAGLSAIVVSPEGGHLTVLSIFKSSVNFGDVGGMRSSDISGGSKTVIASCKEPTPAPWLELLPAEM